MIETDYIEEFLEWVASSISWPGWWLQRYLPRQATHFLSWFSVSIILQ